jgi:hypothetical protein
MESGVSGMLIGGIVIAFQITVREGLVKGGVIHSQLRVV